jgi:hypothetical protein
MAANALAPRPRLKVLPVKGLDPELPTRLLLRIDESRSSLGRVRTTEHQSRATVEEAQAAR